MLIGRVSNKKLLEIHEVFKNLKLLREYNSLIKIKINTVVNQYNHTEYLGDFINLVKPDKWKVFQALSINNSKNYCTKEQFDLFLHKHEKLNVKTFSETNDEMTDSYIMIDPHGRFYQNTNSTYEYSKSILEIQTDEIIKHINFDFNKYKNRY